MAKSKLEYLWLDGYKPTQNIRSKTKVVNDFDGKLESCPVWSFDGSSTQQAKGGSSDFSKIKLLLLGILPLPLPSYTSSFFRIPLAIYTAQYSTWGDSHLLTNPTPISSCSK